MKANRVLALVSAAQLASGLGGMALAIRRRHAFDIPFWRGQPSTVGRDCVLIGTALSAPVVMLAAQAWAIAAVLRRPDAAARRTLGGLGAAMSAGYLAERLVRQRLTPAGWDTAETPVVVAGISLAAAMALIGLRPDGTQEEITHHHRYARHRLASPIAATYVCKAAWVFQDHLGRRRLG